MKLDLSSLEKAVTSLESALEFAQTFIKGENKKQDDFMRAGVIQNFEFTYELCWKFIKRWLENNVNSDLTGITRKELYREAFANNLIEDFDRWVNYHSARNKTSHTYDSEEAENIFETAKQFAGDAKKLLNTLESKND
jgi:nucleotidyltransferase substrate binding protein (TIGR01987 family)